MARTQAADYEQRREAILDHAARLYAAKGFLGASIADLADACKMSKSLIYHYYESKEDILFDVMHSHVQALLETAQDVSAKTLQPTAKFRELNRQFMRLYGGAAHRHQVLLNELEQLPPRRRKIIVGIQRQIIALVETMLREIRGSKTLPPSFRWPMAMLFFGMINWTHTWLDPKGPLSIDRIADLATDLFLGGIENADLTN